MTNLTLDPQVEPHSIPSIDKRPMPAWKRALDIVLVLIALPILTPLLLLVAGYIRLVSAGPIFFIQSRVGHGGEDFRIIKFRTMVVPEVSRDASHREYVANRSQINEPLSKPNCKSELIRGGELIRKLSIDELPQIFNVLIGNMSLVGPRPDLLRLSDYEEWQAKRFEVLPGMTGLWQVSGKNSLSFDQMIDLDIKYVETMSLKQDLWIIARTFLVLLFERNE
ncbi:MAG: sugar transferase [Pirellula sp.]|jgi:lipopolysaccharide/colanic/teichoic acid biosynthesis glycosyltransferase|nr:sugar transferase [Pirellula sp.]